MRIPVMLGLRGDDRQLDWASSGPVFLRQRAIAQLVRDQTEWSRISAYIENDPVKSGLVARSEDYPWSSAYSVARSGDAALIGPVPQPVQRFAYQTQPRCAHYENRIADNRVSRRSGFSTRIPLFKRRGASQCNIDGVGLSLAPHSSPPAYATRKPKADGSRVGNLLASIQGALEFRSSIAPARTYCAELRRDDRAL